MGATFGRGFWILDDYSPLRTISEELLQQDVALFPVKDALWYIPSMPLGSFRENGKSGQGDAFFVAPNPPFGASFTYYLKEGLKTSQEKRRESEKKLEAKGENTPYPGWDAIHAEESEEPPAIVLTISDSAGNVIRRIEGPVEAGFHRVAWDLRYPDSKPWKPEPPSEAYIEIPGPLAAPGSYRVSLARRNNGQLTNLGLEETFEVVQMREPGLVGASAQQVVEFTRQLDDLSRQAQGAVSAIGSMLTEIGAIKQTLLRSSAPEDLRSQARKIELALLDIQEQIKGNSNRDLYNDPGQVSIDNRLSAARMGTFRSSYGPTPTHVRQFELASVEFEKVKVSLQNINQVELPALRKQLDEAGVPWTPGRGVPAGD